MKIKLILSFALLLTFFLSCKEKEEEVVVVYTPTIDSPIELSVSKGDYVDKIKIQWNAPLKSKLFEVYRADSIMNDYSLIGETSYPYFIDSTNHEAYIKYYYKVRVYNSKSEFSEYTPYDYGFVSAIGAPILDSNTSYGTNADHLSLKWSAINGSDKYFIYRSTDKSSYNLIDSTTALIYDDSSDLKWGDTYYYKVKAYNNSVGFSGFSNVDSAYIFEKYQYETNFGNFTLASYIDFDSNGNIYVVDATAGKVKKFDKDYNFINDFISIPGTIFRGIKILQNDEFIIAESNKGKIGFFDSNGTLVKEKTVSNSTILRQITVDDSKNIYVADLINKNIVKLNAEGDFLSQWSTNYIEDTFGAYSIFYYNNSLMASSVNGSFVGFCNLEGQYFKTWDGIDAACIAMDKDNNFYFACYNKVIKTNYLGKTLSIIGLGTLKESQTVNVCPNGDLLITDEINPSKVLVYKQIIN